MMNFTNLDGVIGHVVVDYIGQVVALGKEAKNNAVFVQELLLGGNLAASKSLLEELLHLRVPLWWNLDQRFGKLVLWALLSGGKVHALVLNN